MTPEFYIIGIESNFSLSRNIPNELGEVERTCIPHNDLGKYFPFQKIVDKHTPIYVLFGARVGKNRELILSLSADKTKPKEFIKISGNLPYNSVYWYEEKENALKGRIFHRTIPRLHSVFETEFNPKEIKLTPKGSFYSVRLKPRYYKNASHGLVTQLWESDMNPQLLRHFDEFKQAVLESSHRGFISNKKLFYVPTLNSHGPCIIL